MSSDLPSQSTNKNKIPTRVVAPSDFTTIEGITSPVPLISEEENNKFKIRDITRIHSQMLVTNLDAAQGQASVLFKFTKFE